MSRKATRDFVRGRRRSRSGSTELARRDHADRLASRGDAGELLEVTDAYLLVLWYLRARVNQQSGASRTAAWTANRRCPQVEEAPVAQDGVSVELDERVSHECPGDATIVPASDYVSTFRGDGNCSRLLTPTY